MGAARPASLGAHRERLFMLVPLFLALFFAAWCMRGARISSVADFDSPRHALNGAFLLDMVRHGELAHPLKFGYWYYSRLPALSLPYHPPLFPAFEAFVYALVGVNSFGARIAVALAAAAAVLLLFRLVRKSHDSRVLAFIVTVSFFVLPAVQRLSNTVMLEIPALVCVISALLCLLPEEQAFLTTRSFWFAFFSAAAIWTKQTVFLFLLPLVYVVIPPKWSVLRKAYFWVAEFLVGASAVALSLLGGKLKWNGLNQSWAKMSELQQIALNASFYLRWKIVVVLVPLILCLASYLLPKRRNDLKRDSLYIAWFIAVVMVLLASPAYAYRYLFFLIPPCLVLLYSGILSISRRFSPNYEWIGPSALCCVLILYGLTTKPVELVGPDRAALLLHDAGHRRILFCGAESNGAFIFAVRSTDPDLKSIVIRGDKLAANIFAPEQLNAFVKQYGIDSVVLERTGEAQPWDALTSAALPFLSAEALVEMRDTDHFKDGSLTIYRVKDPTTVPESSLKIPISVLGRDVELRF
jgi:4-amino-4-deoxy-L-arabinose transferase-like glycosyltransferase